MKKIITILCFLYCSNLLAQPVGINTTKPDASAALDIEDNSRGLLMPRMTTTQRKSILNAATGLMVFDTDTQSFWLKQNTDWVELANMNQFVRLKSVNGSSTFTSSTVEKRRYVWELNASHPTGSSIAIPDNIITDACADEEGCLVIVSMSSFDANSTGVSVFGSCRMSYNPATKRWRASTDNGTNNSGIDGNNSIEHVLAIYGNVFFTDGAYSSAVGSDAATGFHFMKWAAYPATTVCRLVIED